MGDLQVEQKRLARLYEMAAADVSFEQWAALRRRAQTDLFFLSSKVLGYQIVEKTHRPICDLLVKKNPDEPIARQHSVKKRMLLYPRGTFKTSIDCADAVQWIVCFPDIRIVIVTAAAALATAVVGEIANHFVSRNDHRTLFHTLFPEHVMQKAPTSDVADSFVTPARERFRKEPTVWGTSILSTGSGWHFDLGDYDDVVSDRNSENAEMRAKIYERMQLFAALIDPFGYHQYYGTPYWFDDAYARIEEKAEAGSLLKLTAPAWKVKPESRHKSDAELAECDYDLLFQKDSAGQDRLTYSFLRQKQNEDLRTFRTQYLCDPRSSSMVTFTREQLVAHTLPYHGIPQAGQRGIAWDFAYRTGKGRDYTVGAVGLIDAQGRLFVIDVIRGRFQRDELAYQVAKSIHDYKPLIRTRIENANGADFLAPEILRIGISMGISEHMQIEWFPVSRMNGAKEGRISNLQALMNTGRLWFSAGISCIEQLYKEFTEFGSTHHDDIPDAISHLQPFLPAIGRAWTTEAHDAAFAEMQRKDLHDLVHGLGRYAPDEEPTFAPAEPDPASVTPGGLPAILGYGLNG
jgi:predicted phage terminase large subunit-like protein